MNGLEFRDELSNQKLNNQPFLFRGKIDLDGKRVETFMFFEDIEAFENYLESIDEQYDEVTLFVGEADIFIETKKIRKSNGMIMGKDVIIVMKGCLDIKVETGIYKENEQNAF